MGLTVKRVERVKEPGRYGDGNGLYLQVTKKTKNGGGVKSWLLRYERDGRERFMGLGPVHTFSLDEARERAKQARQQLIDGIDPIDAREAAKVASKAASKAAKERAVTFAKAAQDYFDLNEKTWRNPKHRAQFIGSLKAYAFPIIGALPVADIERPHVLEVLEQPVKAKRGYPAGTFWTSRSETASRVRGRVEAVLDWSAVRGHRKGENPARWAGNLEHAGLPARSDVEHHPALAFGEIAGFMAELREREGVAAQALQFLIYTAARTNEVIGATWDEFDLDKGVWVIPAGRMKAKREHRVPLSPAAVELLRGLYHKSGNKHVFIGSQAGAGLSNMAMAAVLERMKRKDITVHGFRSAFRDWCAETTAYPNHVVEMALAHTIGDKVEAAYRRGDLFDKRKKLMAAWADYCCSPPAKQKKGANVVSLRGAR
jgi:integrase